MGMGRCVSAGGGEIRRREGGEARGERPGEVEVEYGFN